MAGRRAGRLGALAARGGAGAGPRGLAGGAGGSWWGRLAAGVGLGGGGQGVARLTWGQYAEQLSGARKMARLMGKLGEGSEVGARVSREERVTAAIAELVGRDCYDRAPLSPEQALSLAETAGVRPHEVAAAVQKFAAAQRLMAEIKRVEDEGGEVPKDPEKLKELMGWDETQGAGHREWGAPVIEEVGQSKAPVGRNAPCPCGSGKKYKKCCLKIAR